MIEKVNKDNLKVGDTVTKKFCHIYSDGTLSEVMQNDR